MRLEYRFVSSIVLTLVRLGINAGGTCQNSIFFIFLFLSFITNTTDYLLILFFSFPFVVDYVNCTVLVSPLAS